MKHLRKLLRILFRIHTASFWQYCLSFSIFWACYGIYRLNLIDHLSAGFLEIIAFLAMWIFYLRIILSFMVGLRKNRNIYFINSLKSALWIYGFFIGLLHLISTYVVFCQFLNFLSINALLTCVMGMSGFLFRKPTPLRDVLMPQYGMLSCLMLVNIYYAPSFKEITQYISGPLVFFSSIISLFIIYSVYASYVIWMLHSPRESSDYDLNLRKVPR